MSAKLTIARLKKFGQTFEISVDPDLALEFKQGKRNDIHEVLHAEHIYSDASKGLKISEDLLQKIFKTTDPLVIAAVIVKEGEIQLTAEHRKKEQEQKLNRLIDLIHRQAVDPKTGYPHPPGRIRAAMEQGKMHLDDHRTVEEQFDEVISKLRPILPINIEQKKLTLTIPPQFTGKAYAVVKSGSKILSETWNPDGSWTATVEMPAGLKFEFIDKLNALTHGQVVVRE
ncbi:ribosome assembly factor SBDS [Candidatus Woesearchaeota archaeon]|nr:ribosome assembly factor SBDS [Candidatus Woesearchaeota archaeon]